MTARVRHWDSVAEGEELGGTTREISRVDVVAMAFAARDLVPPVHVDPELARAAGLDDVNVNIISTGGLVGKYICDWSGPGGHLRKLEYRLGVSVYPGDTLSHEGRVTKKYEDGDRCLVDIEYTLSVAAGPHAWGTATLQLPKETG